MFQIRIDKPLPRGKGWSVASVELPAIELSGFSSVSEASAEVSAAKEQVM